VIVLPATESCAGFLDKSTDKSKLPSSITIGAGGWAGITVGGNVVVDVPEYEPWP
jgi:hypothetical protein